jgi:dienelactone hydrolase
MKHTNSDPLMPRIALPWFAFVVVFLTGCTSTTASIPGVGKAYIPNSEHRVPGIMVLHTKGGPTKQEKIFADFLSDNGYYAMTVNYRKGGGSHYSIPKAYEYLISQPNVDADNIAIVGFSLGAYTAFDIADRFSKDSRGDRRIRAVVSWFVGPTTALDPRIGANPKHPATLFVHGDSDTWVSEGQINTYCGYLEKNSVTCEKVIYKDVGHAFDRPKGRCWDCDGYVGWAYRDGKKQTIAFLDEILKGE